MTLPQLGHVTNVNGFISTSVSLNTAKFGRIVAQYALILPRKYDDVTTTRSGEQRLWLFLHLYKTCNNQTSQKRAVCSGLTLNVMMTSFQLGHLTGVYDFVSPAIISIATKSGRMANQHAMNLTLQVMITWSQLAINVTKVYGFISTSMNPITSKLGKMVDQHQHALIFLYRNDNVTTARLHGKH